jgi:alkylation response protein AidB-like acyl-CoA dehydrogenase
MAHVPNDGGDRIKGTGDRMLAAWRVALAAEISGAARAVLDLAVAHVKQREQFGRSIGAFQALQHRLAEWAVLAQGAELLMLEAAWRGAKSEAADLAAAHAATLAKRAFHEGHQLHGAMGLTREHDLFLWSMRLPALWIEINHAGGRDG